MYSIRPISYGQDYFVVLELIRSTMGFLYRQKYNKISFYLEMLHNLSTQNLSITLLLYLLDNTGVLGAFVLRKMTGCLRVEFYNL